MNRFLTRAVGVQGLPERDLDLDAVGPDIHVEVDADDLESRDPILERALRYLRG